MSVFETERLNGSDDFYAIRSIPLGGGREAQRARRNTILLCLGFTIVSSISLTIAVLSLVRVSQLPRDVTALPSGADEELQTRYRATRRIAFGSCSAFDQRPQPLWAKGVIPATPDAWVWLGDMAYLDTSPVQCNTAAAVAASPWCNCSSRFIAFPGQCLAGNVDAARERWQHALEDPDYRTFLDFMCPPNLTVAATPSFGAQAGFGSLPGRFPPAGTDPRVCPRPIFGVYDDHDYGWNNGNRRLPNKAEYKRMFLDAVGEAPGSSRRSADAGLQAVYRLNGGGRGRDVDLVLLDERWYRDPLPCELRRAWCEGVLAGPNGTPDEVWCRDFLLDDGTTGRGSCCTKDGDLAAWCGLPSSRSDPLWSAACDPTSREWGTVAVVLGPDNATLLPVSEELWATKAAALWPRLMQARDSPVCEVLGRSQRQWLSRHLAASGAALSLVASGSVLLGSLNYTNPITGRCSNDDWNCWPPAQLNLLHTLANTTSGCVVVLTGDYHYGDIKVVQPGAGTPYAGLLKTDRIKKPIYQLMSSGMTESTASYGGLACNGTFREDLVGLRPAGRCSYTSRPNFGMIEVDWEAGVVHLTVRNASGGGIAVGDDGTPQHVAFALDTCMQLPV